jgi:hypothetical protein
MDCYVSIPTEYILQSLSANSGVLQPAIAESSASAHERVALVGKNPNKLKREHLSREVDVTLCTVRDESDYAFGPKVKPLDWKRKVL